MDPVELSDDRLLLRLPRPSDVPRILEACQDPEMVRWTTIPVPYRHEHAVAFVDGAAAAWAQATSLTWAITDASDGDYLGSCDLRLDGAGSAEVGFAVAPWARRRGVATGALRLACSYAFEVLGCGRVEWLAHVGNEASRGVAAKVGFRPEGTQRARCVARGVRHDGWVAGLLPGELR